MRPVGPEHFSLSATWLFSAFNHLSQKIAGRKTLVSSRNIIVLGDTSLAGVPTHLLKIFRPLTAIVLVTASRQGCCLRLIACFPGEGRTGRTHRSSSGPTSDVFKLVYGRPCPAHRLQALLPPLPVFVCFFCGGLGVGEKPTRGELVRSTHRVPSPFISSQRFPFEIFR